MPRTTRQPDEFAFVILREGENYTYTYPAQISSRFSLPNCASYSTIEEVYQDAFSEASYYNRCARNSATRYWVYPRRNTNAYRELLERLPMPERRTLDSIAASHGRNNYSFVIVKDNSGNYVIEAPPNNPCGFLNEPSRELFRAYRKARSYADSCVQNSNSNAWNVWPREYSREYYEMLAPSVMWGKNEYSFKVSYKRYEGYFLIEAPRSQVDRPRGARLDNFSWSNVTRPTFAEAYQVAEDRLATSLRNTQNPYYNVWPPRDSEEYLALQSATPFVAAQLEVPDDYSFIVRYNPASRFFDIIVPRNTQIQYSDILNQNQTLKEAVQVAEDFAKSCRVSGNEDRFNVWPALSSRDYAELKRQEAAAYRETAIAEPRSYYITWDASNRCYKLNTPPNGAANYLHSLQRFVTLFEAYETGFHYVRQANAYYCGAMPDSFSLWPMRGTTEYTALVAHKPSGKQPEMPEINENNTSGIKNFAELKNKIKEILVNPSDIANETKITSILYYSLWVKYKNHYTLEHVKQERERIAKLFANTRGVNFIHAGNLYSLSHVDNTTQVYMSAQFGEVPVLQTATKSYASRECLKCSTCNKVFQKALTHSTGDGKIYCTSCLSTSGFYSCTTCRRGVYHHEDEGCPEYNRMPHNYVFGYSVDVRKVIPKMFKCGPSKDFEGDREINGAYLRYGLELEILPRDNATHSVMKDRVGAAFKGHAIMKTDSSIGDYGVEIVTAPATLQYHRTKLWKDFFTQANSAGVTPAQIVKSWSTGTCGLHIHITRQALDKVQLSKLLIFYHETANAGFLSKIAGREVGPDARYCKSAKKRNIFNVTQYGSHHDAITVSGRNGGKTVEVRIFRGNASKHGIMRALDFVDATVKWAAFASAGNTAIKNKKGEITYSGYGLNYKAFIAWFNTPTIRSQYPDLWRHLIELNYLRTKHKSKDSTGFNLIPTEQRTA